MPVINNATFLYTKIQNPVAAFNKLDSEFSVDVVLSKADAKALNKAYPKQKSKEYDNEEFVAKFKIDLPHPDQDEQFVLKLKKSHTKNGRVTPEQYFPRVFLVTPEGNVDKTYDIQVGNGSKGKASYRIKATESYGDFLELQSILVEELVVYTSKGGSVGSDFGVTQLAEVPQGHRVVVKQGESEVEAVVEDVKPVAKKPVAAKKAVVVEDEDSMSPF